MSSDNNAGGDPATMTLEAFADTIIPGEKRWPGDRAVAGAAAGGGAVVAGAVDLLRMPAGGLDVILDSLVEALNEHARGYATEHGRDLDETVPPFVALDFADRTELVRWLIAPGHPEKDLWVSLVMFSNMAWDTGAQLPLLEALASGHAGLRTLGFAPPDSDGVWRFPDFSYRRVLADLHPETTPTGSPA